MPNSRSRPAPILAICGALAASWILLGCTKPSPDGAPEASPAARTEPTILEIELPTGVALGIDDQEPHAMPLPPQAIEPGKHTLVVNTACQAIETEIDAPAHETTRIDRDRVPGLELGTLEITARDLEGKSLVHAVMIDDKLVGGGKGTSTAVVPACKYRVKVVSEGLGGFIEDIDFGKQAKVERDVVLAPGPDMVRIHGGPFTLGPSDANRARWMTHWGELLVPRIATTIETFDIDRAEVTAEQWNQCRSSAAPQQCYSEAECEHAKGCPERVYLPTNFPRADQERFCNTELVGVERHVRHGRNDHPMNCVARWEAEDYCQWVGKRLPTAAEWEYTARSGNDTQEWPWGAANPTCSHGRFTRIYDLVGVGATGGCADVHGTSQVCSHPDGNNAQGACDLVGNVQEYISLSDYPHAEGDRFIRYCRGPGWRKLGPESVFQIHASQCGPSDPRLGLVASMEPDVGFRCARNSSHSSEQPR